MVICVPLMLSTLPIPLGAKQGWNTLRKATSCNPERRSNSPLEPHQGARRRQLPQHASAYSVPVTPSPETSAPQSAPRRSGNYHPSIWSHSLVTELMRSTYLDERYLVRLEELKLEATKLLMETREQPLLQLRTIDSMQRLGVAYHFEREISKALDQCYESYGRSVGSGEEVALGFRLLRQHGYQVSSENMLRSFKELVRKSTSFSSQDIRCLLAIYDASHLAIYGEADIEEAKNTTAEFLRKLVRKMDDRLAKLVDHSLEMPLHWMMPRLEARHYINLYEMDGERNPLLLELAKLDFNIVQSIHQRELRELSRWWTSLGLSKALTFSRDRLVENYLWAIGIAFEPKHSDCRLCLTKLVCILTVIDDIYDVHGSLDELELFTLVVESWKVEAIESLPDYMKPCFLALYNFVDQVAVNALGTHGWDVKPFICEEWKRLCKAYYVEAKWFYNGYKPPLTKYLENAWITVGGPVAMVHAYLFQGSTIPQKLANCLHIDQGFDLIQLSSLIGRISDDLGTSEAEMERGDVWKSVECFMGETCESKERSRESIKRMVGDLWKQLNEECYKTQLPKNFVCMVVNMARTALCIFQYGDGIGTSIGVTRDRILSLFVEDIQ
uniref:Myrcene synthase, chloroplastic n=1 Tax=Anthurium amnicola TaxID=1678845 RepID=A0A1D1XS94_9ARAE